MKYLCIYTFGISVRVSYISNIWCFRCRVFKRVHLESKCAPRLDNLINLLEKYLQHLEIDREVEKKRPSKSFRLREINSYHKECENQSNPYIFEVIGDGQWSVEKSDGESQYILSARKCAKDNCLLICAGCRLFCAHQLVCECPSSQGVFRYCKHIHLFGSWINEQSISSFASHGSSTSIFCTTVRTTLH